MKYFYTAGYYYNCPSCDSYASDPEDIMISPYFENKFEMINHIKSNIPDYHFYSIGAIGEYGTIHILADFMNVTGGHRLHEVKFELENHTYSFDGYGKLKDSSDEGYKRFYHE